ncbi:hypothetical protein GR210_35315, partial [Rhizobium leguminosarum]|nr:hypothetical protein [Rhizobium leguminosarum]
SNRIVEAVEGGIDTVVTGVSYTLDANVENAVLTAGGITVTGNAGDNTYTVSNAGNTIVEAAGAGIDKVVTTLSSYTLGDNVENLEHNSWYGSLSAVGNALDNQITINGPYGYNDTLDGGAGADTMAGIYGDDIYVVDNAGDVVVEVAGQGNDTVVSSVSYTLGDN